MSLIAYELILSIYAQRDAFADFQTQCDGFLCALAHAYSTAHTERFTYKGQVILVKVKGLKLTILLTDSTTNTLILIDHCQITGGY